MTLTAFSSCHNTRKLGPLDEKYTCMYKRMLYTPYMSATRMSISESNTPLEKMQQKEMWETISK